MGIQTDLVAACVPALGGEAHSGRDMRLGLCSVGSHHGFAEACCTRALEGMRLVACHGGRRVGNHRETPRCWPTRQKGRAVRSPFVDAANDCRVDSSGDGGTNVCEAVALLFQPPPPACGRSAVVKELGPPRYAVDCGDGAIARRCRRVRCRLRTRPRSSSPRWKSCGCRRWMLVSAQTCCRQMMFDLLCRDIRVRRVLTLTLRKRRWRHCRGQVCQRRLRSRSVYWARIEGPSLRRLCAESGMALAAEEEW